MAAKIKKGDKVVVHRRPRQGPDGEVIEVRRDEGARAGARRQHGQAPSAPERDAGGRHRRQGGADPRVEYRAGRSQGRQADPGRLQVRRQGRRAQEGARRQAFGRRSMADTDEKKAKKADKAAKPKRPAKADQAEKPVKAQKAEKGERRRRRRSRRLARRPTARPARPSTRPSRAFRRASRCSTRRRSAASLTKQFGYTNRMQVPAIDKIVINMGIGEGVADRKKVEVGRRRSGAHRRPEGGDHQGAQVDRDLQAARRPGDRLQGHAAQGAHVRIPRPADQHRAAARARLPRASIRRASTAAAITRSASRNTSCSRRSTTTRSTRSGAWTSSSAPPRGPTTRRARLLTAFNFRSGSEARSRASDAEQQGERDGEEELDREEQPAPPDDEEVLGRRARLKAIASDKTQAGRRSASPRRSSWPKLPRNSSATRIRNRCETDRPAARLLPQAQAVAHRAARTGLEGPDSRPVKSSW